MTRYTKLDKRRAEHDKRRPVGADKHPDEEAEPQPKPPMPVAAQDESSNEGKASSEGEGEGKASNEAEDKEPPRDATQLLKRAKLMRLKAKKAKTDEKRRDLLRQCKDLERQASAANGERGRDKGKGKSSEQQGGKETVLDAEGNVETNPWKVMEAERRRGNEERNAHRREKRAEERLASQRCYACRGLGHSAKDCQASTFDGEEAAAAAASTASKQEEKKKKQALPPNEAKECCYRCGSTEHNLSKCRRPAPKVGPQLPFASCFVCQAKGHIASQCPQNAGKGIYPNGGCCKLCRSVEHLARDCDLNRKSTADFSNAAVGMGVGAEPGPGHKRKRPAGADEDDFHALSRARIEVDTAAAAAPASRFAAKPHKKVVSF